MNAFGALLWAAVITLFFLFFGGVVLVNGTKPSGWGRTRSFYVWSSLLSLPIPVVTFFLSHDPGPALGLLILAGALRQIACIPIFLLGLALAGLALTQKRPLIALLLTAALNLIIFLCLFVLAASR